MAHKHLLFHGAARDKVLRGTTALADAIAVTLGPKSRSVLIDRPWGAPIVCNDGVTIAKELELEDADENLGVKMLKQAAIQTSDQVGDGTSTATVLAQAIWSEGLRNVVAGASAIELKRGLEKGLAIVTEQLRKAARPVGSRTEREQIAAISAHNDAGIGALVAEAMERVGGEGVVTVEEAKAVETELEVLEGMEFDRGFASSYFVNDNDQMRCVLESPRILLYDKRITNMRELLPVLERVVQDGSSLLIVSEEVESDALATLVVNKLRGTLLCCAVKAPGFGDRRKQMLEDIAILTGGKVLSPEMGTKLEDATLAQLGRAQRVVVTRERTTIIGGLGDKQLIRGRCEDLRREIKMNKSDYDREKLEERLAKLAGGVAVIRVGAASESELRSRKDAFDDAIHATKAAVAEGIVPGAGLSYLRCVPLLEEHARSVEGDTRTALRILARALEAPTRTIARNSDADDGVVVDRMMRGEGAYGFDASSSAYGDLAALGIIDPVKVVRIALENAVSVASTLLLVEATMTEAAAKNVASNVSSGSSAEA